MYSIVVQLHKMRGIIMEAVTYSQARKNLSEILKDVAHNHEECRITRSNGDRLVIVEEGDYNSLKETAYLLQSKANANNLFESIEQSNNNEVETIDLQALMDSKR